MATRPILKCVRADKSNLGQLLDYRSYAKFTATSAKKRLSFAHTIIEFYADILLTAYRIDDAETIAGELNKMAAKTTKVHLKYAQIYPAEFSGFTCEFPNLENYNKLMAAKTAKSSKANAEQTDLPFDNTNTLERRLDRLESILARLDKHLQPTEES